MSTPVTLPDFHRPIPAARSSADDGAAAEQTLTDISSDTAQLQEATRTWDAGSAALRERDADELRECLRQPAFLPSQPAFKFEYYAPS